MTMGENAKDAPNFEALTRQHQDAVYRQMVRVCGNHEDEVAKSLNISITAMKSRLHRARELVRKSLDQALASQVSEGQVWK